MMIRHRPPMRALWFTVIALIALSTALLFNGYTSERGDKESAQATAVDERGQKKAVVSEAELLAQQATAACAEASGKTLATLQGAGLCRQADKTQDTIEKATDDDLATPTVTGPSQAQVNAAVRLFLGGIDFTGPPGAVGARGPTPTAAQVTAAVVAYCATRDQCRGLPGAAGSDGSNGAAGKDGSTGERGPTGADGATGATGADGQPGADGKDGRGISTVACTDDGTWLITYTDGSTQTVDGPCRASLLP